MMIPTLLTVFVPCFGTVAAMFRAAQGCSISLHIARMAKATDSAVNQQFASVARRITGSSRPSSSSCCRILPNSTKGPIGYFAAGFIQQNYKKLIFAQLHYSRIAVL